ncbi:MAG: lysophospholipase [Drouetiella hepatica Uher 2000/2452]|jgi:lysophospholipase L1-like esterase|uniref:Lysophospholipase n=1 Tax=Drouetiella hepatica Uher 2000/2452 TaxID=904376 RepID=A0A951QB73_9CYAN|nr:lysophospholipase [Drouetiella hepatica Uher 2000/2452]
MSHFCLIAASLVSQGQIPGWQLASAEPPTQIPSATAISRLCDSPAASPKRIASSVSPTVEINLPEPSRRWKTIPIADFVPPRRSRPGSGSQLLQQRWAALRSGTLYTRTAIDSFREAWLNATEQPTYEQWINLLGQEAKMVAGGQGVNRLSVLVGDSLAMWFPADRLSSDRYWLNQGISGDTTTGILNRLSLFNDTQPDAIHVMAGINDLRRGATDAEVVSNLTEIMRQLKQAHPNSAVYIYSILPTRLSSISNNRLRWLNYNIAAAARQENATFLNLQSIFVDDEGNLQRDLTTDGLHLSALGYEVWQTALKPIF